MTLKTERSETCSMDKGVCALGDSGQHFIMIQQLSDIQNCLNVFLAPKNLGIDIKIIKFESIVMNLWSFGGVGGHF